MDRAEIQPILKSAIRQQVIENNRDIGDEGLIDTISSIVTISRLHSIHYESDHCLKGDLLEPTDAMLETPVVIPNRSSNDESWEYSETVEGSWELSKK